MSDNIWENIGSFLLTMWTYIWEGAKYAGESIYTYMQNVILPALPSVMRIFSNRIINLVLFVIVALFFVTINIITFCMFGSDKGKAKRNRQRISESKLIKMCFFGGAIGGFMGMLGFRHKTQHLKFKLLVPLFFILHIAAFALSCIYF